MEDGKGDVSMYPDAILTAAANDDDDDDDYDDENIFALGLVLRWLSSWGKLG